MLELVAVTCCVCVQVVMSVAQLYHHLAPRGEVSVVAKSLVRLLRSHREVQSVVLNCIASISTIRKVSWFYYRSVILCSVLSNHDTLLILILCKKLVHKLRLQCQQCLQGNFLGGKGGGKWRSGLKPTEIIPLFHLNLVVKSVDLIMS